ncbi:MAG TPA: hypothetical protein VGG19_02265 [Tepidisphaeraceae bacterium]|jgi:hypothetical protein
MSLIVIFLAFLTGGLIAAMSGLEIGFVCVYFPCQLLFSAVDQIPIAYWPHISPPHAAIYGVLVGSLLSGRRFPRIRLGLLDAVMVLFPIAVATSTAVTSDLHFAANRFDTQLMEWLAPYFLARLAFTSEKARAICVQLLCYSLLGLAVFGLIEFRFIPYFISRHLQGWGLWEGANGLVYHRFGFMRAMLAFGHPIDLGNVMLMFIGMIPVLALTSEIGMSKWYVKAGWACAFFLLVTAISFTAYFGVVAIAAVYLFLKYVRFSRRMLMPMALVGITVIAIYTSIVLSEKMPPRPPSSDIFAESLWIRELIVHRGWTMAKVAGWFGYGVSLSEDQLQLASVDNAYLLMVLTYGWVTLFVFLLIPIVLGSHLSRALKRAQNEFEARPLMIAAATITGIMIAMYTVWFGFVYANIYVVLLGFSATLADFFLAPRVAPQVEIGFDIPDPQLYTPLPN